MSANVSQLRFGESSSGLFDRAVSAFTSSWVIVCVPCDSRSKEFLTF